MVWWYEAMAMMLDLWFKSSKLFVLMVWYGGVCTSVTFVGQTISLQMCTLDNDRLSGCIICSSPSSTSAEITFCGFRKMPSHGGEKNDQKWRWAPTEFKNFKKRASSSQETKRPPRPLPRTLLQSTSSTREHSFGETAVLCQKRIWESATGMCEIYDDLFLQGFWCFCRRHPKKKKRTLEMVAIFSADKRCHSENSCESSYCCFAFWFTYAEVVFKKKLSPGCQ